MFVHHYILSQDAVSCTDLYRFRGAFGPCAWPMNGGLRLGTCGIWNFLWRLGYHPTLCHISALPDPRSAVLWASLDEGTDPSGLQHLSHWINQGGYLVSSGDSSAWAAILGWSHTSCSTSRPANPYAALAWLFPGFPVQLIAPNLWPFAALPNTPPRTQCIGATFSVQGERQSPDRAILKSLNTPALVTGPGYCYLNGNPFAALQSWLQGQVDLQPWLAWRHRMFWLDEWVSAVADVVFNIANVPSGSLRPGVPSLSSTTVILRHDVDHSRDLSYLNEVCLRGLTSTYAILKDSNTTFWRQTLNAYPFIESAFHYNTGVRHFLSNAISHLLCHRSAPYVISRRQLTGRGLARQVAWAKHHGIGVTSIMRHLMFLPYPEFIDSLDYVFTKYPEVIASSSLFRSQLLRWGCDHVDGSLSSVGEWPDPQHPFWFPFKLANAAAGGRILRGWECTSLMECEPDFVDQILSHRVPNLPQRVFTIGYHPAHASGRTFYPEGSLPAFRRTLDVLRSHNVDIKTSSDVFRLSTTAIVGAST
jgi:hypothetical protein